MKKISVCSIFLAAVISGCEGEIKKLHAVSTTNELQETKALTPLSASFIQGETDTNNNALITKLDNNGNTTWQTQLNGSIIDFQKCIVPAPDGDWFIIAANRAGDHSLAATEPLVIAKKEAPEGARIVSMFSVPVIKNNQKDVWFPD